jgi:alkylation response protein AidB-like acyl-CoA dehydrogenase
MGSCELSLSDVLVPDNLVLGEVGNAWANVLPTLNNERILMAAFCCGIIDGVLEDAVSYASNRQAFGRPIGTFQIIQHYLADVAMWQSQAWLLTLHAAWLQSLERPCGTESNMAKVVASEYATQAADHGIQILGGMGYSTEMDMQRYWRDARLFRLSPITNEMARNSIAEQLGLPRSF